MALLGLLNFSALTLCVLVLADQILQAQALKRGFFGNKNLTVDPSLNAGLCASYVTIHGYKCQELEVTTKDGYILSLQRITEGRAEVRGNVTKKKEPVILQHGVMVDGQTWFFNSPERNLPMILADNGFDVWITNTRGTKFSRKHTFLDASNKVGPLGKDSTYITHGHVFEFCGCSEDLKYWNWSWDELVSDEMPAIFDYVSNQTEQKVNYVGHSLGTLVPLVAFSEGKLVNQLKAAVLLSPIAYLSHMSTALGVVAAKSLFGESVALLGVAEFSLSVPLVKDFVRGVCAHPGVNCNDMFTVATGENCCLTTSTFDLYLKSQPQSSSVRNLRHLAQIVRTGVLTKFDFQRLDKNFLHYRQISPPIYNLDKIPNNLPIFMSYGGKDALSDVQDVKHLLNHFKDHDVDKLKVQFIKDYAHMDFIMGVNAKDLVYNDIIEFFNRKF